MRFSFHRNATAGPVPVERVIDHYPSPRPPPVPAGPVPVERMVDHYPTPPVAWRSGDSRRVAGLFERPIVSPTGTGPAEQCELPSHGTKTTSNTITVSPAIAPVLRSPAPGYRLLVLDYWCQVVLSRHQAGGLRRAMAAGTLLDLAQPPDLQRLTSLALRASVSHFLAARTRRQTGFSLSPAIGP